MSIPFPSNIPSTNPYPLSSLLGSNLQNYFVLDPNMIAALNRLAAALEKYNERSK